MVLALVGLLFFAALVALVCLLIVAIVAKLRKRNGPKRRYIALAFVVAVGSLFVAVVLPAPSAPAKAAANAANNAQQSGLPGYLLLRPGQHAYLDSNSEGDGTSGTLFRDWRTVAKWYSGNFASPSELPHVDLPTGTEVVVDSWRTIGSGEDAKRMILVHTAHSPLRAGYSYDVLLLPSPPVGSTVIVAGMFQPKARERDKGVTLFPTSNAAVKNYIQVRPLSKAVVLGVDQHRDMDWPYHVRILDGPQKGRTGYLSRLEISAPSGGAGGGEYSAWCKCVSMYLNTGSDK